MSTLNRASNRPRAERDRDKEKAKSVQIAVDLSAQRDAFESVLSLIKARHHEVISFHRAVTSRLAIPSGLVF